MMCRIRCIRGICLGEIKSLLFPGNSITITDPEMTRSLMNLDESVALVMFAFEHVEPRDLFVQKSDASTIGDLAIILVKMQFVLLLWAGRTGCLAILRMVLMSV